MKAQNPNRGSVMFIVLVFIISISVLAWITTIKMNSEADFIQKEFSRLKAYTLCISGFEFIQNRLSTGTNNYIEILDGMLDPHVPRLLMDNSDIRIQIPDLVQDKYRKRLTFPDPEGMEFILNMQDSAGLINVFKVDRTLFKNLLEHFDFPAKDGDIILDSLYDWMDKDNFTRPNGAETDYYLEEYGYPAANRLVDSRDELRLIRGFDKNIFDKIASLLDFSIESRGINPNTMPARAFYMFKGIGEYQIERILSKRLERLGIEGLSVLTMASGYNFSAYQEAFQFFTSNTTYVKIKAPMDEQHFFYIMFRLDRKGGGGSMKQATDGTRPGPQPKKALLGTEQFGDFFNIFDWQEGTDVKE